MKVPGGKCMIMLAVGLMLAVGCSKGKPAQSGDEVKEKVEEPAEEKADAAGDAEEAEYAEVAGKKEAPAQVKGAAPDPVEAYAKKAALLACDAGLAEMAIMIEMYYDSHGQYPDSLSGMAKEMAATKGREPKLLDPWRKPFIYELNFKDYRLCSSGPDKKGYTEDDICRDDAERKAKAEARLAAKQAAAAGAEPAPCKMVKVTLTGAGQGSALDLPLLEAMDALQADLEKQKQVRNTISLSGLLKRMNFVMLESKPEADRIPETKDARLQMLLLLEMNSGAEHLAELLEFESRRSASLMVELASRSPGHRKWLDGVVAGFFEENPAPAGIEVTINTPPDCMAVGKAYLRINRLKKRIRMENNSLVMDR